MLFLLLFGVIVKSVACENILFITLLPSPSHHIWSEVFIEGLLTRGHNVTLLGHYDSNIRVENYTVIKVAGVQEIYKNFNTDALIQNENNVFQDIAMLWELIVITCQHDLHSEALEILLDYPKDLFDLIVFDVGMGQCSYPLIEHFGNPPVLAISPFGLSSYISNSVQNHFYSYYPIYVLPYTDEMTFLQRVENTLLHMVEYYIKWYVGMPKMYRMAQEKFGEDITPFDRVERRIEMMLVNYDPVLEFPLPVPQHIVPVGGLHIKPVTKLPDDIQQILDGAKQGVIYFSFGTNIRSSWLTKEMKQVFLDTFSKLKHTVLWKYDEDDLKYVPKNVIIRKWYQQNNILAHKNVKLFITHNGELSTQEAMYHGVPVIGIPFFIDQKRNAGKVEAKKLGKRLLTSTITRDVLHETIVEIINNPIYKKNMQEISDRFHDRLNSPLETAVFWLEYVLKHKDISHLSIRGRDMTWYERQNLDVLAFMLLFVAVLVYTLSVVFKWAIQRVTFKIVDKVKQN